MGLFNFLKQVGKSLTSGSPTDTVLRKEVSDLGLNADNVTLSVEGEKVVISGQAESQETLEKIVLAVGNSQGISSVETTATVSDDGNEALFHTVEAGDSLSAVAKKVYGDASRYLEIFEANKPMLSHPDKIYPGQVLRIPNI